MQPQKLQTENVVTTPVAYKRNLSQQPGGWKCKDFYILKSPILKLVYQLQFLSRAAEFWRHHLQLIF